MIGLVVHQNETAGLFDLYRLKIRHLSTPQARIFIKLVH